ncbi:uncharacterized protein LOC110350133 [Heterocephalus glaber]|uniref:Uncharacterized protein LOC110350133 n=1 Tax=Heterocephalus glaber TaxID=10181 RepID=A0AAX6T9U9_HETGA|nr:uncharacterized protein LOC110350133 [Heterocephalus glaber]
MKAGAGSERQEGTRLRRSRRPGGPGAPARPHCPHACPPPHSAPGAARPQGAQCQGRRPAWVPSVPGGGLPAAEQSRVCPSAQGRTARAGLGSLSPCPVQRPPESPLSGSRALALGPALLAALSAVSGRGQRPPWLLGPGPVTLPAWDRRFRARKGRGRSEPPGEGDTEAKARPLGWHWSLRQVHRPASCPRAPAKPWFHLPTLAPAGHGPPMRPGALPAQSPAGPDLASAARPTAAERLPVTSSRESGSSEARRAAASRSRTGPCCTPTPLFSSFPESNGHFEMSNAMMQ